MGGCQLSDEVYVKGIPAVVMENEHLRIVILVGKGTDIYEFRHKASDTDFLWKAPWGVRNPQTHVHDTPNPLASFMDFYFGGWQELFPNAGDNCIYKGAELGFHGEVCKVPWEYRIVEDSSQRVSVGFWVRTVRTPFLVEKTLTLETGKPVLFIEETVTNEGTEPMDFMWGHHPAFGAPFLCEHCRLFTPANAVETHPPEPARQILPPETRFDSFPMVKTIDGRDFDLSRLLPPTAQVTITTYLMDLKDGWYCFVNERTRLGFAMRWDVSVFRFLWFWEEICGTPHYPWWGRCYVVGIEPQSSVPGLGLIKAIERGTQLTLQPGGRLSTRLCATAFLAEGIPRGVNEEGQVIY